MLKGDRVLTPARLLGMGFVFIVFGLFIGSQSWDLDHRLPPADTLDTVRGAIDAVHERHGLEMRLKGQPEAFRFPRSTRPSPQVKAALEQAAQDGNAHVELLYSPKLARTFTGEQHRLVYELRIDGRVVHSYAEARRAWRANLEIGRVLAQIGAGLGIAFVLLAFRKASIAKSWTARDVPRQVR